MNLEKWTITEVGNAVLQETVRVEIDWLQQM